jgi:hypothetical protein
VSVAFVNPETFQYQSIYGEKFYNYLSLTKPNSFLCIGFPLLTYRPAYFIEHQAIENRHRDTNNIKEFPGKICSFYPHVPYIGYKDKNADNTSHHYTRV